MNNPVIRTRPPKSWRKPSRRRKDMEHVAGEDLQQQGKQETRRHRAEDRDQPHRIVDPAVLVRRRHDAERNADQRTAIDDRGEHQFESRCEGFRDVVVDRPLGQKGQAEIAVRRARPMKFARIAPAAGLSRPILP